MQAINQKEEAPAPKKLCLCRALMPSLLFCKLAGLFPLTADHSNGYCVFKKSNFWLLYSIFWTVLATLQLIYLTDVRDIFNVASGSELHELLSQINDIIYDFYIILLHILCIIRYPKFIKAFNNLVPILQEGLLCQSSLGALRSVQYWILGIIAFIFSTQYLAITWLHYSDNFNTDFDYNTLLNKFTQNMSFAFYVIFITVCSVIIGVLGCYEKLVVTCLRYKPVHPLEDFEQVNFKGDFMGIIQYTICKDSHPCGGKLKMMQSGEMIEYLRYLHEEISQIMYDINTYLNPQLLCHTVVELTVLIINWYAVIIYMAFKFTSSVAMTKHFLNCVFVVFHTLGLFVFLKCAQHQNNIVKEIARFFLEYSTRVSTPEEHQQIRLFIDKIQLHKPLTANGIFTIDLGIAGPICANILTYVLVALQFNVTKT